MEKIRHITRYNGQKGTRKSFCGWRLCLTRQKETYVRYFTDIEYGDSDKSLAAALEIRDAMLAGMAAGVPFPELCERYRKNRKHA